MSGIIPARWAKLVLVVAGALALAGGAVNTSHAADDAQIFIVQGLPGRNLDVTIDGKSVAKGLESPEVGGPYKVKAGSREVTFSENGDVLIERTFSVTAGSSSDVVIHLPAASATDPNITVFRNDVSPVPGDKANLVVAHMAKVPPADIRVNDKVLFENIANGESLKLTVPVDTYEVAIVPTGETKPVILGPAKLTVKGGAVNAVYAIGDPGKKTMAVAVHIIPTGTSGSGKPSDVNTGTGGQAVGKGPVFGVNLVR